MDQIFPQTCAILFKDPRSFRLVHRMKNGFVQMLSHKCLLYGKDLYITDERGTTKMCHRCKHNQDMPLWKRTYRCENCGLVMDRDENSPVNIYQRFVAWIRPYTL